MYLFITYKPNSEDRCGGYTEANYSADLYLENNLSEDNLIVLWARYLLKNKELQYAEVGYDFFIFRKGVKVYATDYSTYDAYCLETDDWDEFCKQEKIETENIERIEGLAEKMANEIHQNKLTKETERIQALQQKNKNKALEEQRILYETLKKKFEDTYGQK